MAVLKYYNTATSAWEYIAASTTANFTTWKKTMSGGETSVSGTDDNAVTLSYTVGLEQVFINGVLQVRGSDYTATNGTSITGLTALVANDIVSVICYAPFNVANTIAPTVVDAKGDLIAGTAADTVGRLAVGTNNQVLVADSSTATGLKWVAPTNWSLLNAGGTALTGATTITVSGISNVDKIMVVVINASSANASSEFALRLNGDTATNYTFAAAGIYNASTYLTSLVSGDRSTANDRIPFANMSTNAASAVNGFCLFSGCNSSGLKIYNGSAAGNSAGGHTQTFNVMGGTYTGTSTISSVSVISNSGNFDAGTIYVYTSA